MPRRTRQPWLLAPVLLAMLLALTAALPASTAKASPSTAATACGQYDEDGLPHITIAYGSGAYKTVRHAQCLLYYVFNQRIKRDGIFGPNTRQAVINAQTWCRALGHNIEVDGIVGPVTWRYLHWGC